MATFTSSLPDWLLKLLDEKSQEMSVPKNKIIEKALTIYLEQLIAQHKLSHTMN